MPSGQVGPYFLFPGLSSPRCACRGTVSLPGVRLVYELLCDIAKFDVFV